MTRSGVWLLRCIAVAAFAALVLVIAEAGAASRAASWLAVPDLAALELTTIGALGVASISLTARGRRAIQLEAWTRRRFPAMSWTINWLAFLTATTEPNGPNSFLTSGTTSSDIGAWTGPIEGSFGSHFARVTARTPAWLPQLDDVRGQVAREWENDRRQRARDEAYAKMRAKYNVGIEATVPGGERP